VVGTAGVVTDELVERVGTLRSVLARTEFTDGALPIAAGAAPLGAPASIAVCSAWVASPSSNRHKTTLLYFIRRKTFLSNAFYIKVARGMPTSFLPYVDFEGNTRRWTGQSFFFPLCPSSVCLDLSIEDKGGKQNEED
jgi:hypothetical protein